ncbi:hypothetical protein [uncultured Campylobacter sp.]|uniref:hypothetical protein n=1 Tax=uncultured Campylobacter sp. TaxID=218934 RepID=UPI002610670B|nr:hypothetical protein [uncultured Campylobacter sp.]
MIKTDRILKFNAVFLAYGICNVNLKAAIRFINFISNFSPRYVRLEAKKTAQSQNRASAKMAAAHYSARSQSLPALR